VYRRSVRGISRRTKDPVGELLRELGIVPEEIAFEPRFPERWMT
jgi:hypothetical protein